MHYHSELREYRIWSFARVPIAYARLYDTDVSIVVTVYRCRSLQCLVILLSLLTKWAQSLRPGVGMDRHFGNVFDDP